MIAVGALALTATTLLAGCGSKSTEATPAAEPAAAEAPTSVTDGMVKPAGVSDEQWTKVLGEFADAAAGLSYATTEEVATQCETSDRPEIAAAAQEGAAVEGTSVEEWTAAWTVFFTNYQIMACSMIE
jgi:hypothetical protein